MLSGEEWDQIDVEVGLSEMVANWLPIERSGSMGLNSCCHGAFTSIHHSPDNRRRVRFE